MAEIDFDAWLQYGRDQRWITVPVCSTHDGIPLTKQEIEQVDNGGDPCIHVLRLCEDASVADEADDDTPQHRKTN